MDSTYYFYEIWNFPNYIGALDAFTITLLGMADAFRRFIWVSIGAFGSSNDSGVFQWSDLGQALNLGQIDLPACTALPRTDTICPFFIVADEDFPLKDYLMKPYTRVINLPIGQKIFNYRLSRARLVIECAFGLLTKKCRILENPLNWKLGNLEKVIMSLVCLHNFLITDEMNKVEENRFYVNNEESIESPEDGIAIYEDGSPETATVLRNTLKDYFMSEYGQIQWQWQNI